MNHNCHTALTTVIAALLLSCSAVTQAATPDSSTAPQVIVHFADLNLATPEGAQALYARIRVAAKQVCGPEDDRNLMVFGMRRACMHKAIADAIAHVSSAQLTALHQAAAENPAGL